jgi:cytochrome c-type biogenesis protein CcmE
MAEMSWEKSATRPQVRPAVDRWKFIIVGVVLVGVVGFLLISGTLAGGRYFMTVNTLVSRPELQGKVVKISGAVIGTTIENHPEANYFTFTMSHLTDDINELNTEGGLAKALNKAVNDPAAKHLKVVVKNQAMPDLLQNEAQAILTGRLADDGTFYADEILLKCPSKYQAEIPKQT